MSLLYRYYVLVIVPTRLCRWRKLLLRIEWALIRSPRARDASGYLRRSPPPVFGLFPLSGQPSWGHFIYQ